MKGNKTLILGLGLAVFLIFAFSIAAYSQEQVKVYGEVAYTADDVQVVLYVDANTLNQPLCSFGVKLTYPEALTIDTAKTGTDTNIWHLESESYTDLYEVNTPPGSPKQAILIGGKLEQGNQGVSGTRVPLGTLWFTHNGETMPPELDLTIGRTGNYKNFVCINGEVIDDPPNRVVFEHPGTNPAVKFIMAERGDANIDDRISSADMFAVRSMLGKGTYTVFADCNADERISSADMFCVRSKL